MTDLPKVIDTTESLGRGIFDSKKARQAQSGKVPPRVFRERTGVRELSMDRVSFGHLGEIAEAHDAERTTQQFHGWAELSARDATKHGRTVIAKPVLPTNPYHAEIVLPDVAVAEAGEEQDQHALSLAMASRWLPRPAKTSQTGT